MPIKLVNWTQTPKSIDVLGFGRPTVPAASANGACPGIVVIPSDHYAALLALDPSDRRRKDLDLLEVHADSTQGATPRVFLDPGAQREGFLKALTHPQTSG